MTPKAKGSYFVPKHLEHTTLSYIHFIENSQTSHGNTTWGYAWYALWDIQLYWLKQVVRSVPVLKLLNQLGPDKLGNIPPSLFLFYLHSSVIMPSRGAHRLRYCVFEQNKILFNFMHTWSINMSYSSCWHFNNLYHANSYKYAFGQLISHILTSSTNFLKIFQSNSSAFDSTNFKTVQKLSIDGNWTMPCHLCKTILGKWPWSDRIRRRYLSLWMILKHQVKSLLIVSYSNSEWVCCCCWSIQIWKLMVQNHLRPV